MDESVHLSLERFTRMQDQIVKTKQDALTDVHLVVENAMTIIYRLDQKLPAHTDKVRDTEYWLSQYAISITKEWELKYEIDRDNNKVRITHLAPRMKNLSTDGGVPAGHATKNPLAR